MAFDGLDGLLYLHLGRVDEDLVDVFSDGIDGSTFAVAETVARMVVAEGDLKTVRGSRPDLNKHLQPLNTHEPTLTHDCRN